MLSLNCTRVHTYVLDRWVSIYVFSLSVSECVCVFCSGCDDVGRWVTQSLPRDNMNHCSPPCAVLKLLTTSLILLLFLCNSLVHETYVFPMLYHLSIFWACSISSLRFSKSFCLFCVLCFAFPSKSSFKLLKVWYSWMQQFSNLKGQGTPSTTTFHFHMWRYQSVMWQWCSRPWLIPQWIKVVVPMYAFSFHKKTILLP